MKRLILPAIIALTASSCTKVVEKEVIVHDTVFIENTVNDSISIPIDSTIWIPDYENNSPHYANEYRVTPKGLVWLGGARNAGFIQEYEIILTAIITDFSKDSLVHISDIRKYVENGFWFSPEK